MPWLEKPDAPECGRVAGEPLQAADLHRGLQKRTVDTRSLAEDLGGTRTRTTATEDIRLEDRRRRGDLVAMKDLTNESRDVDVRRTGAGARSVETEKAARCFDSRFVNSQR